MPLTKKGEKIKRSMKKQYGKEKGEDVFYASEQEGTIKGVTHEQLKDHAKRKRQKAANRTRGKGKSR